MPTDNLANSTPSEQERLDEVYHRLRDALHALGLCIKVMEGAKDLGQMTEYAAHVESMAKEIERLFLNLVENSEQS